MVVRRKFSGAESCTKKINRLRVAKVWRSGSLQTADADVELGSNRAKRFTGLSCGAHGFDLGRVAGNLGGPAEDHAFSPRPRHPAFKRFLIMARSNSPKTPSI
jgi:hypothetical protein